ncbi:hypothetical protein HFO56_03425 [Rhizobium laguerreae]|uniref:hypothetical protein n=1 Tax=Rhizobium laguerreae TaxID=1076926 RepID=UPI001C90C326|nr:hypothetical protein [Rhizobium laguerreae]MBY3151439.1 hypothetical protein [Rhizobium laguerreae]
MRIRFEHPAVVSGTWDSGQVRRELVRVASGFEIKELSEAEAPRSFDVIAAGGTLHEYRTVGGRHYKKWTLDMGVEQFNPDSNIMGSIYTGKNLDFPVLTDLLKAEIRETRKHSGPAHIENTERPVLKRESRAGLDSRAVALIKAPILKRWQWLGPETDAEIADWRSRTAEVLEKIIMVEGCLHTLSYEPCYRLNASGTSTHIRRGPAHLVTHNMAVYGNQLKGRPVDPNTGLENLGYLALLLGDQFFGANERDEAVEFAKASGWGLSDQGMETIVVHDDRGPSADVLELETVRHARMVYEGARLMIEQTRRVNRVDQYSGRPVDKNTMRQTMEGLRQAILEWQNARSGVDGLAAPFEDLLAEIMRWEDGNRKLNGFDLIDQITAFKIREDMADVTVVTVPWSAPTASRRP